ncbi:MAG: hypothetical protein ACRYGK_18050 [Janthinobacterium lividum]
MRTGAHLGNGLALPDHWIVATSSRVTEFTHALPQNQSHRCILTGNLKLGKDVRLSGPVRFGKHVEIVAGNLPAHISIADHARIDHLVGAGTLPAGTVIHGNLDVKIGATVGNHVSLGANVVLAEHCIVGDGVTLGDFVKLGPGISLGTGCIVENGILVKHAIDPGCKVILQRIYRPDGSTLVDGERLQEFIAAATDSHPGQTFRLTPAGPAPLAAMITRPVSTATAVSASTAAPTATSVPAATPFSTSTVVSTVSPATPATPALAVTGLEVAAPASAAVALPNLAPVSTVDTVPNAATIATATAVSNATPLPADIAAQTATGTASPASIPDTIDLTREQTASGSELPTHCAQSRPAMAADKAACWSTHATCLYPPDWAIVFHYLATTFP